MAHLPTKIWLSIGLLLGLANETTYSNDTLLDPSARARLHPLEMNKPATDFFEGAILGNGAMGVIVCTRPDGVMLHFGHNAVWDIRLAENNKEKLLPFEKIWERVKRNTPEDRTWYGTYCKMARENYAQPYPRPWPCGTVLFVFDRRKAELLGHKVNIATGLCEVFFLVDNRPASLEILTDMTADRIWMRMKDVAGKTIAAPFHHLEIMPEEGMMTTNHSASNTRAVRQVLPVLGDNRENDEAVRLSVRLPGRITPTYAVDGDFIACIQLDHGRATQIPDQVADVPEPSQQNYQAAMNAGRKSWATFWGRAGVKLDDQPLERAWYHNMYFLNCSVRPDTTCPGLFANWSHKNIGTAWHGGYVYNYNVQQPFWGTFSSNHLEKHLPYVEMVHFILPVSRSWARECYQLPGAFFPHAAYPVEMTMTPYPVPIYAVQVSETPWTVQSLWWHYLYSMDMAFLREKAFEPIREAVILLNAYMRRPEGRGPQWKDDRFHIYPTVVPEEYGLGADPRFNSDCTIDLVLTKFVFQAYLKSCQLLNLEKQETQLMREVREILDHFPNYSTAQSQRGTVYVSVPGENPDTIVYNIPVPLAPVFPGEDIGLHSPPETLRIAINTWENHQNRGCNDLVMLNLQGARLGRLDLERFKRQINYCLMPNGTCTDKNMQSGWRYRHDHDFNYIARLGIWFENFALPVVINECLLQSYTGHLRLFPNWPMDKAAEFHQFRAVGAFLVSAECAKGQVDYVRVHAEVGGPLKLINPWPGPVKVQRDQGITTMHGQLIELDTRPLENILFLPQGG